MNIRPVFWIAVRVISSPVEVRHEKALIRCATMQHRRNAKSSKQIPSNIIEREITPESRRRINPVQHPTETILPVPLHHLITSLSSVFFAKRQNDILTNHAQPVTRNLLSVQDQCRSHIDTDGPIVHDQDQDWHPVNSEDFFIQRPVEKSLTLEYRANINSGFVPHTVG
ncbi:hypothetical protein [Luteibacter sp.]|uniref:hypothetical protein n=1 Tax=Luteibacter sp. TaxID=1886636 RepID=UPI003F81A2DC